MKFSSVQIIVFFLFFQINIFAQSPDLLKSEGEIPEDFITLSRDKYQEQIKDISKKKNSRRDRKDKKQFLLESNYAIDDILQSGMVLFNDPASKYVNEVLGNLPYESSILKKKKLRAYILNSSAVNAFAVDQGVIFVTLGLLAKLENEAQLAFILAHELMHVKHEHSIDKFIQTKNIDKQSNRDDNMSEVGVDRNIFQKSMYSRSLEEEADADGLELFLKSNYDPRVILNTFNILHYSYLPFEEITFEKTFFEDEHFVLPSKYWMDTLNQISPMQVDAEDEEKSSHPSSSKRLAKLKSKVEGLNQTDKQAFILPKQAFFEIQEKARYQIPFLNLYTENFPAAIYASHLLLQKYPDDLELKKVIAKALYMESKYRNNVQVKKYTFSLSGEKSSRAKITKSIEGASQQVYSLLTLMSRKDLTLLALKYNWKTYQANPEDKEMKMFMEDTFVEFAGHFDNLDSTFSSLPNLNQLIEIQAEKTTDSTATEKEYFWRYAFVDELKNEAFKTYYEKGLEQLKGREKDEAFYESAEGRRKLNDRRKRENKQGKSLGIDKVVVVNPFYLSIDSRRNKGVQYIRSEEKQAYFSKAIKKYAGKSKVKTELLDVTQLSPAEVDKFNDVSEVNHFFSQQIDHDDLYLTPSYNQNQINAIAEKYGTDYFLWTGVISLREKNNYKPLLVGIFAPYVLPLLIPNVVQPEYDMLYYAILFDIKTGKRSIIKMDYFDKRDSKAILNAHIYDVFHQIAKK
jgi:hypothetical protein